MSRTPISDRLVHQSEQVEHNARLFDQLCMLVEEVAYPIVGKALMRENAAIGAEVLADEAKLALEGLVSELALEGIDEPGVIEEVRKSLEQELSPPSQEECGKLTNDVTQVLMSTWLEILRIDLSSASHKVLSDELLPLDLSNALKRLLSRVGMQAPEPYREEGLGPLAIDESDAAQIMKTLRHKLFSRPRLIELPFDLVVVGAPECASFAMTKATYEEWMKKVKGVSEKSHQPVEEPAYPKAAGEADTFVTPAAQVAQADLCAQLSEDYYERLVQQAGIKDVYLYRLAGRV